MTNKEKSKPKYWLKKVYGQQRQSSKIRGHSMPTYSKEELGQWIEENFKDTFLELFNTWVANGFDKKLVPSLDRIDNTLPYSLDNLQLVTWEVNERNYKKDRANNKRNIPVLKLCKETNEVLEEFPSIALAAESVGAVHSNIRRVCEGGRPSAKGFRWCYK